MHGGVCLRDAVHHEIRKQRIPICVAILDGASEWLLSRSLEILVDIIAGLPVGRRHYSLHQSLGRMLHEIVELDMGTALGTLYVVVLNTKHACVTGLTRTLVLPSRL